MKFRKLFAPVAMVLIISGCSFSGKSQAPIVEGPTSTTVYTVQPGDTLYSVARRYGVDPKAVARENGMTNPNQLRVGQRIRLSVNSSSSAIAQIQAAEKASSTTAAAPVVKQSQAEVAKAEPAAKTTTTASTSGTFMWPAQGNIVKSFGPNNKGVDISGKEGDSVVASADGKVIVVGNMTNLGNLVMFSIIPLTLPPTVISRIFKLAQGNMVKKGQKIATIGKTDSEAPRVHFEIRKLGKPLNPVEMLPTK